MELHEQVRQARKDAKLTQSQLALLAQVGRKDISRFENGENVTMKTFLRIVGALPNLKLTLSMIDRDEAAVAQPAPAAAAAPPAEEAPSREPAPERELALLRTIGQLLVEITGGEKKPVR